MYFYLYFKLFYFFFASLALIRCFQYAKENALDEFSSWQLSVWSD